MTLIMHTGVPARTRSGQNSGLFLENNPWMSKFYIFTQRYTLSLAAMALACVFTCISYSCSEASPPKNNSKTIPDKVPGPAKSKIVTPADRSNHVVGQTLEITIDSGELTVDSFQVYLDGNIRGVSRDMQGFFLETTGTNVGTRDLRLVVYFDDGSREELVTRITLLSDITPRAYGYRVIQSFPHDTRAYTQGLVYDKGFIIEGTGQYGESTLRKTKLETGQLLKVHRLAPEFFGEGVAVYDDKIIQITWKSRVGFVYDRESFALLKKIYYPNAEGWGITYDGTDLIMSDGSEYLIFLDKEFFTEKKRVQVLDNKGPVRNLNELEYINGLVYANVYQTDLIVTIDPATGRVMSKIDLAGLLKPADRHSRIDVLNGIAHDPDKDRLFVTGKNWPKIFEIEIFPR